VATGGGALSDCDDDACGCFYERALGLDAVAWAGHVNGWDLSFECDEGLAGFSKKLAVCGGAFAGFADEEAAEFVSGIELHEFRDLGEGEIGIAEEEVKVGEAGFDNFTFGAVAEVFAEFCLDGAGRVRRLSGHIRDVDGAEWSDFTNPMDEGCGFGIADGHEVGGFALVNGAGRDERAGGFGRSSAELVGDLSGGETADFAGRIDDAGERGE
jgi:hypothetical protein